jgi:hypothetical protein
MCRSFADPGPLEYQHRANDPSYNSSEERQRGRKKGDREERGSKKSDGERAEIGTGPSGPSQEL